MIVAPGCACSTDVGASQLPADVELRTEARGNFDVMLFFVTRQAELVRRFPVFERRLEPAGARPANPSG